MSERQLFRQVALHFAMGAMLGALFIASLLVLNVQNLADIVLRSTAPILATVILLTGGSVYFGFGAAITGFHFLIMDHDHSTGGPR
ncbi:MAG: hypothetical protein V4517_18380 [Pseudomonadota bacterium]